MLVNVGIDPVDQEFVLLGKVLAKGDLWWLFWPRGWIPDPGPHVGLGAVEKGLINVDEDDELGVTPPGHVAAQEGRVGREPGGAPAAEGRPRSGDLEQDGHPAGSCLLRRFCVCFGICFCFGIVLAHNVLEAKEEAVSRPVGNHQSVLWDVIIIGRRLFRFRKNRDKPGLVPLGRDRGRSCGSIIGGQVEEGRFGNKIDHLVI